MMVDEARAPFARPATSRFVLAVALVALCWIIGNAPNSGPDEPSHMITSAGIVRFQGGGEPNDGVTRIVEVPAMVGLPDPSCWAFVPDATPACSEDVGSTTVVERATTSFNYPVWAMILPGLASYVPWPGGYDYLARALSALIPVVLVGAALAFVTQTRRLVGAAALLGVTPIAWFTFGTVNPSAVAIGGGLALLAGLLTVDRRPRADLLAVAGWVAVVLPRRDGPLWATVVVVAACALTAARPSEMWGRLRAPWRWAVPLAVLIAVAPVVWRRDVGFNLMLALAPLALLAVEGFVVAWNRAVDRTRRAALVAGAIVLGVLGAAFVVLQRPGGYDANLVRLVVANTGDHLTQLVGLLGWLNVPVPTTGVLLYWTTLGALAAVTLLDRPRAPITAGALLATAVVVAWLLELGQGSSYGDYWQGRYTMPLAVGLPLMAVWGVRDRRTDILAVPVAAASWVIANLAFFAAQRRWAVGNDGTWYVWRWNTWNSPLPPMLMLVLHAAATAWLALVVVRAGTTGGAAVADEVAP